MVYLLIISFLVTTVLFFLFVLKLIFPPKDKLQNRMEHYLSINKGSVNSEKVVVRNHSSFIQLLKNRVQKKVLTKEKNNRLELKIAQAGLPLKPEEYVLFQWISSALSGGLFFLLTGQWVFILIGGIAGFFLPNWYLRKKRKDRVSKFNEGLADMISTIIGSLRAGFSFPQALKSVAEEAGSPIKEEMEFAIKEMQYGKSMEDALYALNERMPSEDLDLMIQAILIQRQVGGNLATVLDKIVETIRDRAKIHRQISTLTAQGRLSGYVIALLPVFLGFFLYMIQPDYIGTLFHNVIGVGLISAGLISGVIGFLLIKKITNIEV